MVQHVLDELGSDHDAVLLLQPTSPFRSIEDLTGPIALLASRPDADSVISVVEVGDHHPARMKWVDDGRLVDPPYAEDVEGRPRQELRPHYLRNGAVYLTRTASIRRGTFKGGTSLAWVMPRERSVNIDDPMDLVLARALLTA